MNLGAYLFYAIFDIIWLQNGEKACVITLNLLSFLLTFNGGQQFR